VKTVGAIPPLPQMSSWCIAWLIKYRDTFTVYISDLPGPWGSPLLKPILFLLIHNPPLSFPSSHSHQNLTLTNEDLPAIFHAAWPSEEEVKGQSVWLTVWEHLLIAFW
jgi:hypothetical protein